MDNKRDIPDIFIIQFKILFQILNGNYVFVGLAEKVKLIDGGVKYSHGCRVAILIDDHIFVLTMPEEEAIDFAEGYFSRGFDEKAEQTLRS